MNLKKLLSFISLGFGSGLSPIAPGTAGSIVAACIYYFLFSSLIENYFHYFLFILFIIFCFLIGLYIYPRTVEGEGDPGSFVWDEFVGMWVACLPIAIFEKGFFWLFIAFILFRLFDIWKPGLIKQYDDKSGAINVMMDDVLAGALSAVILFVALLIIY
jgi:phosphatidylglycerophosphatase A